MNTEYVPSPFYSPVRSDEIEDDRETALADARAFLGAVNADVKWREAPVDRGAINAFVRCYWQGKGVGGAASSGEQAAAKMGAALLKMVSLPSDLDGEKLRGFMELIRIASIGYSGMDEVRELLGGKGGR
jgi:hypothetical protein